MNTQQDNHKDWPKIANRIGLGYVLAQSFLVDYFYFRPVTSVWDYEGFTPYINGWLICSVISIISGLLIFLKSDITIQFRKTSMLFFIIFLTILIGSVALIFIDPLGKSFKYALPLKKIETIAIKGTLKENVSLSLHDDIDSNVERVGLYMGGGLKEFPGVHFDSSIRLKNEVINVSHNDSDGMERLNSNGNGVHIVKMQTLPAGTSIKLRVRPEAYENLLTYMKSDAYSKALATEDYDPNGTIDFYELSVDDEVLIRKFGLK